jgi:hypothetical protein
MRVKMRERVDGSAAKSLVRKGILGLSKRELGPYSYLEPKGFSNHLRPRS